MMKTPLLNTIVQIVGKIIVVAISLLTTGILTRRLGVIVYGQLVLVTSIQILFDALADFGTRIIGIREASRQENEQGRILIWSNVFWLRLLLAAISFGLALIVIEIWPELREIRREAIVALAMIGLTSIAGSFEIIWQTQQKMIRKVAIETLFPILFLAGFLVWKQDNLIEIMAMYLLARSVSLIVGYAWIKGKIRMVGINSKNLKQLWSYSLPMGLYLLLFSAYDRSIDAMIISRFWGVGAVAIYGLAYKIYGVGLQPAYFLVSSIFPILSSTSKNKVKVFRVSAIILLSGALGAIIVGYLGAPLAIGVLGGDSFTESVTVLRILIVAFLFSYMGHLFGFTLISRNKQKTMLFIGLIVLVFNVTMNLIFIPHFGVKGAAWVTVLSEFLGMSLMYLNLR